MPGPLVHLQAPVHCLNRGIKKTEFMLSAGGGIYGTKRKY